MNTAKKLAPLAEACATQEFEQATIGHTPHFVSDRLNLMLGLWNALPTREYLVWSQLMVRARESRSFNIEITHRALCKYASVSESTMRAVLYRLSTLGFIEILVKKIDRYGKNYIIRPTLPRHLLPDLKAELDRCRGKNKIDNKKYDTNKAPAAKEIRPAPTLISAAVAAPPAPVSTSPNTDSRKAFSYPETVPLDTASEKQYLSWDGQLLSEEEAYLPMAEKPTIIAPYQPGKNKGWIPSFSDLEATISPSALIPTKEQEKRLQIDVVEWAFKAEESFFKQSHQNSNSRKGYGAFVSRERIRLDREFPIYLTKILPKGTESWINTLLDRMQAYQLPCSNAWFPLTREMLDKKQKEYEEALKTRALEKQNPTLSPHVAVSIPTDFLNQIITIVKTFRLSQEKILEIAYHVMHFCPDKILPNEEEKKKFNLRIAIKLIKKNSWGCPLGLETKRTRYREGVSSC
jgi:hypothetical protein